MVVHYFVKICFLLLNILYLFGFFRKMTPPLTMVISWLMEYSLRYDLPQLKSELKDLFPNLVVLDKLEIPNKKTLVDLATLRLIVNRCLIKLVNREHLCMYYVEVSLVLCKDISMTSLLAHTVAQPTKQRFLPKNLSQLIIFVIGLAFTWV